MGRIAKPSWLAGSLEAAVSLFNHNPWTSRRLVLLERGAAPAYVEDGLLTHHRHPFVADPRFRGSYERAVRASGSDYHIQWRVHTALWAAETSATLDGAFVECGTGRGFFASAICTYLDWRSRPFLLYDSFKPTLPDATGQQAPDGPHSPVYASGPEDVARNFEEWPGVQLVVGDIPATLSTRPVDRVAFLHLDLNHAAAEEAALRHFWPALVPGAAVLFDDYGFPGHEAQHEAADRVGRELGFSVLTLPTGQGLAIKPAGAT